MKAFISWSGRREGAIALAFKAWLETVFPELQPFVSPDLPKGQSWFDALTRELRGARIGFMCLAPPRAASDWQLVEAGAVWKAARDGSLFPICFDVDPAAVAEPLRHLQLTRFARDDFLKLVRDLHSRVGPDADLTARETAFDAAWAALATQVDAAMRDPDDGVHTTRGFIHEVAGGWWERVQSARGDTRMSWMWFAPSADGARLTIDGRGFDEAGKEASRWYTDLVAVHAHEAQPLLSYYWQGRHPKAPDLLFGGKGWIRFSLSPAGRIVLGSGEFKDVCLNEARAPSTKLVDLRRASPDDQQLMQDSTADAAQRAARIRACIADWP